MTGPPPHLTPFNRRRPDVLSPAAIEFLSDQAARADKVAEAAPTIGSLCTHALVHWHKGDMDTAARKWSEARTQDGYDLIEKNNVVREFALRLTEIKQPESVLAARTLFLLNADESMWGESNDRLACTYAVAGTIAASEGQFETELFFRGWADYLWTSTAELRKPVDSGTRALNKVAMQDRKIALARQRHAEREELQNQLSSYRLPERTSEDRSGRPASIPPDYYGAPVTPDLAAESAKYGLL